MFAGDKTVRVYSSHTFHELPFSPIEDFQFGVNYLEFTTSGHLLAAGCSDGNAYVFHCTDTTTKVFCWCVGSQSLATVNSSTSVKTDLSKIAKFS